MDKNKQQLAELSEEQYEIFRTSGSNQKEINILIDNVANYWIEIAKKLPNPKPLFGNIWHEGEVAILFSNTGKGKSILGVQIADSISKGKSILNLETVQKKVVYFDFELSTKAFQIRYTDEEGNSYQFNDNFIRVEIDRDKQLEFDQFALDELVLKSIKYHVKKSQAQVVMIDNITFLSASNEKSKEALLLMKLILDLSRTSNIAVLLIAHTPKRDIYKPIQLEDLAGSKALSNFTDVCFCIGESVKGADVRYIKQLKNRNYTLEFHENNTIECLVVKEDNLLQFKFIEYNSEKNHLNKSSDESSDFIDEIMNLKNQKISNVEIGKKFGISESAVRRRIIKFQNK